MKAHRTDLLSLVFGLLFVGIAAWWLLARILGLGVPSIGWFVAGALVVLGLLGLVGAAQFRRTSAPGTDVGTTGTGEGREG